MAVRLVVRHPKSAAGEAGEIRFEFEQTRIVIGRSPGADVRLPGLTVSDTHATIERAGDHYTLRDAGSSNGTRIDDKLLVAGRATTLQTGDEISIAEFSLTFEDAPLQRQTTPERTASLARRMLSQLLGDELVSHEGVFLRISEGPERGTVVNFGTPPSRLLIGRGEECDLQLSDVDVSRAHIELVRDVDGVTARDLASKNGLDVNGRRVRERRLKHGDALRVGVTTLLYQDVAEQALRELEHLPDQTFTRTQVPAQGQKELAQTAAAAPAGEPVEEPPAELDSTPPTGPVDLLIYALAVFVLVASAVGLVWLFH